jgi:peptidoglycan-N-acetylglucosamine deacetylase
MKFISLGKNSLLLICLFFFANLTTSCEKARIQEKPGQLTQIPDLIKPMPIRVPVNCKVEKCAALTFDDGPDKETLKYLSYLKEKKITATFFVVGKNIKEFPDILEKVHNEGHQICNHTYSHNSLQSMSEDKINSELGKTNEEINKVLQIKPSCFRSPFGAIPKKYLKSNPEWTHVGWTADTNDWRFKTDTTRLVTNVSKDMKGNEGKNQIILFHDVHPQGLKALPLIVSNLEKKGFVFVPISDLNLPKGAENMGIDAKEIDKDKSTTEVKVENSSEDESEKSESDKTQ